jgi:hypothetical protein
MVNSNSRGDAKKIEMTKTMFDPIARAASKKISDIHGKDVHYTPDLGSAAANQIGPLFGQYRESMVLLKTMLAVNGGKKATDMLFLQPVFDNFIVDSQSLAQVMYYANNKAVPEVLEWDIQEPIYEDFVKKVREGMSEVSKLGTIFVDRNSKYYGVFSSIDREYKYIQENEGKIRTAKERQIFADQIKREKEFKQALDNNNYTYMNNRDTNESFNQQMTGAQIAELIKAYMAYKVINKKKIAWIDHGLVEKKQALDRVKRIAKDGMIAFMN